MYRQLPQTDPNVLQLLGVLLFQTGRNADGKSQLLRALEIDPHHVEALTNLGVALHEESQFPEALSLIERALAIQPNRPDLLDKRGFILQDLDRHEEAIKSFELAVALDSQYGDAWFHLGNSLQYFEKSKEAEGAFEKFLKLHPQNSEALTNLGVALYHQMKLPESLVALRQSIQIRPSAEAYRNLATVLTGMGSPEAALSAAATSASLEPKNAEVHLQLAQLLHSTQRAEEALKSYFHAVTLRPSDEKYRSRYAVALHQNGEFERSNEEFQKISEPSGASRFSQAVLVPIIPQSSIEIERSRSQVVERLQQLKADAPFVPKPERDIGQTSFYWSYHSKSELPLQQAVIGAYQACSPDLFWQSPHVGERRKGKLKVGVVSSKLNQHTIGKLFINLVGGLRDEDIEVVLFDCCAKTDEWTHRLIDLVDSSYKLIPNINASREFIADQKCDAIFYPEIGMDPITYYLAFSRLAPLQFMTWGHPSSPALPHIDCFLSSHDLEREGSEVDYAERLIKFNNLMTVFNRPEYAPCTRVELGLPEDRRIYTCPQSLFKIHPDMDPFLAEILRKDQEGLLVFLTGKERHWDSVLMERFKKFMPDVADRVVFLRQLNSHEYIGLCDLADAVLDTFYFGGGNSSLEAFSVGAPIVTLPGQMLRGRITLAQYNAMGISELIASDPSHYAELSLKLAMDREWHREMKNLILERNEVLYDNPEPISELKAFVRLECQRAG